MDKLKNVLAQTDTVLFVGSGISLWSGLPSWPGMIEELAQFVESCGYTADLVRSEATRGDLLQAASYGFDKLSKSEIAAFMKSACRYGIAKPHEIHRKIVSLGPNCFITTNYDDLLEQALRLWKPELPFNPPVTNRHLTETAQIVHSHAFNFIFKPHGDASDSESIILTREQYRELLPNGERHNALESLKTLLATRPVVYLGFGLRDPDFLYIRDLLANTYRGGVRDHYAVMADITEPEQNYWRRQYGIHLVSYSTTTEIDGKNVHGDLLKLLDTLLKPTPPAASAGLKETESKETNAELILALARHSARMASNAKESPEFQIRVRSNASNQHTIARVRHADIFNNLLVDKFLDAGPDRAVLIGAPGAGKTYALRQAAVRLSVKLNEVCLAVPFDDESVVVPILIDLKLYRGDLGKLVSEALPRQLPLETIVKRFRVKFFLDAFNEMPKEYRETGSYEEDFAKFAQRVAESTLIISSRTDDGLNKIGYPIYCLDRIDDTAVTTELSRLEIVTSRNLDENTRNFLHYPLYLQMVKNGAVSLSKEPHPRDFLRSLFSNLENAFNARFGRVLPIETVLSIAAYDAMNRGEEAFLLSDFLSVLLANVHVEHQLHVDVQQIVNWLVSQAVLIPHYGGRISFSHQTVTEYLAARELAYRYLATPKVLLQTMTLTRWDQALFQTLGFLPKSRVTSFIDEVIRVDLTLALKAAQYLEFGRDEVVSRLLRLILERIDRFDRIGNESIWVLETSLPLSAVHEPLLWQITHHGDMIGAAAVIRLVGLLGLKCKSELINQFFERRFDLNYCVNGLAKGLKPFAKPEDIFTIMTLADSVANEVLPESAEEDAQGFISGCADFLSGLDIIAVWNAFCADSTSNALSYIRARLLCNILRYHKSSIALDFAGRLLLLGVTQAAAAIYFIAKFSEEDDMSLLSAISSDHIDRLVLLIECKDADTWALKALKTVCAGRPDLAEVARSHAAQRSGIPKAAILWCASDIELARIFQALRELCLMNAEEVDEQPIHLLEQVEINWCGNEELLVQLLKIRNPRLAIALTNSIYCRDDKALGKLEIGSIQWWLEWLSSDLESQAGFWLRVRLSWLLGKCTTKDTRREFLDEFNKGNSRFQRLLADSILIHQEELTTDDFSCAAIAFLLEGLDQRLELSSFEGNLIGQTATKKFVAERLLPLVPGASEWRLCNLEKILKQAGRRHGRRYLM